MISKHPRLFFFPRMSGWSYDINNFLPYYAYANSEDSGKFRSYLRSTWFMIT